MIQADLDRIHDDSAFAAPVPVSRGRSRWIEAVVLAVIFALIVWS